MNEVSALVQKTRPALLFVALAVLVTIFSAIESQLTLRALSAATEQRGSMKDGRLKLTQLMSALKDIETGARGFVLTGKTEFLDHYDAARVSLPEIRASAKQLLVSEGLADFSWDTFDALLNERIRLAETLVLQRRADGFRIADQQGVINDGKRVMDQIRTTSQRLDDFEVTKIAAIDDKVYNTRTRAATLAWLTTLAIAALTLGSTYLHLAERKVRLRYEEALQDANRHLEARVAERTRDLSAARERIARFAREQERSIEAERQRISREVHDQIGAVFTGIKLIVRGIPHGTLSVEQDRSLHSAIEMGVATSRRIAAELRPPLLDDFGLGPAVERLLESVFKESGIQFSVRLTQAAQLDERQILGIFRIIQESSTNVLRHAVAKHFQVTDEALNDDWYQITMQDDGVGISSAALRPGALGLTGMHERAELLGGTLQLETPATGGTVLRLQLPLMDESDREAAAR